MVLGNRRIDKSQIVDATLHLEEPPIRATVILKNGETLEVSGKAAEDVSIALFGYVPACPPPTVEIGPEERRYYFSHSHFQAACAMAQMAHALEVQYRRDTSPYSFEAHIELYRVYVVSAIVMSVAFLEAAINELYADAVDSELLLQDHLSQDTITNLARHWKSNKDNKSPALDKYDKALKLARAKPLEKGTLPYQDAKDLIFLRNALIHYEPEWISEDIVHKMERRLRSKRFKLNPLLPDGRFYPERCLSHGCARWAVLSSTRLVSETFGRLGVKPRFKIPEGRDTPITESALE